MSATRAVMLGINHPHSLAHLRTLQLLPEIESIVIWDAEPQYLEQAQAICADKIVLATTDLQKALNYSNSSFALVSAATPISADLCIEAFKTKHHVLAEKPIGHNSAIIANVLETARQNGRELGVCYQNRGNPLVHEAHMSVKNGLIGELSSVEIRVLTTQVQFRDPSSWLFSQAKAGGGILSWLGCHYLDMMEYVGNDQIVSVSAEVATRSGENIDVEDTAVVSLRFASGAVGSLHMGYTGSGYHNLGGYDTHIGFYGRGGRLYWVQTSPTLNIESTHPSFASAPIRSYTYNVAKSDAYGGVAGERFVQQFLYACENDPSASPAPGERALRIAKIIESAYESSRTGTRQAIM
jgi:predicted dehydrogenase